MFRIAGGYASCRAVYLERKGGIGGGVGKGDSFIASAQSEIGLVEVTFQNQSLYPHRLHVVRLSGCRPFANLILPRQRRQNLMPLTLQRAYPCGSYPSLQDVLGGSVKGLSPPSGRWQARWVRMELNFLDNWIAEGVEVCDV